MWAKKLLSTTGKLVQNLPCPPLCFRETAPFIFIDQADTCMFNIEGKQPLSLLFIIPIIYSVNTFLKEKQKVHIFCIYFQISTFLKMGV